MVMNQAYTFQGGTFSLTVYAKIIQLWITTMRETQLETMFVVKPHTNSSALMFSSRI